MHTKLLNELYSTKWRTWLTVMFVFQSFPASVSGITIKNNLQNKILSFQLLFFTTLACLLLKRCLENVCMSISSVCAVISFVWFWRELNPTGLKSNYIETAISAGDLIILCRTYTGISVLLRLFHCQGGTVDQWLALLLHGEKVLGLILSWGTSSLCGVCIVSPCLQGFLEVLRLPPTIQRHQVRLTGARRCERECEWLFVSICQPCDELATCPRCAPPSSNVSWDWLQLALWPLKG